jgi:hypothetical protein
MTSAPRAERLPRKRDDVLVAEFETELVVLVVEQRQAHRLDEGLSLVLSSCDGTTTAADLVAEVSAGTGESAELTAAWLEECLERLRELGVLEAPESDLP